MKTQKSMIVLVVIFLVGFFLLLYPIISNYVNEQNQTTAIATYEERLNQLEERDFTALWNAAGDYNRRLAEKGRISPLDEDMAGEYETLLNANATGIMGYLSIPSISVNLPIYHGTEDNILQIAVGHLPVSSLPAGGKSTHSAVSGHRGLPSATLLRDLGQMAEGDLFFLNVLDQTLAYEVDQILIVMPEDTETIDIVPGQDLCTLVTCTPYGVNSHRLLVRGQRVDYNEAQVITGLSDATQIDPVLVASAFAVPVLVLLFVIMLIATREAPQKKKTIQR